MRQLVSWIPIHRWGVSIVTGHLNPARSAHPLNETFHGLAKSEVDMFGNRPFTTAKFENGFRIIETPISLIWSCGQAVFCDCIVDRLTSLRPSPLLNSAKAHAKPAWRNGTPEEATLLSGQIQRHFAESDRLAKLKNKFTYWMADVKNR